MCKIPFIKNLDLYWEISNDHISFLMYFIVIFVSLLVHIYSIGYMRNEKRKYSYFKYLALFTFFMLVLVSSKNFVQLFVGWEGVGLCSYLLIGFYREKESACKAALKAFVTNRVGDAGLLIGIAIIFFKTGSLNFETAFYNLHLMLEPVQFFGLNFKVIDWVCIFLFIGCMGKSAQIILHVWLPDAMEGPTPVSALIHAATMVTAGVFLMIRCNTLFAASEIAQNIIMIIGGITIVFGASIAIVQTDIKKIIAYSTCSQLGYMVAACGALEFQGAFFHLFTHAFFKALLFLGAGNVIHQNHHEQNIMKLPGKLYKNMPFTTTMMIIGTLAIIGFPPFSGYFSKDFIIESIFNRGMNNNIYAQFSYFLAIFGVILTAIYSLKLIFYTFFNNNNSNKDINESNFIMNFPIFFLSIGSIFSGIFGKIILKFGKNDGFFNNLYSENLLHHGSSSFFIEIIPIICLAFGILSSYFIIKKNIFTKNNTYVSFVKNNYYIDIFYEFYLIIFLRKFYIFILNNFQYFYNKFIDDFFKFNVNKSHIILQNMQKISVKFYFLYFFVLFIAIFIFINNFN